MFVSGECWKCSVSPMAWELIGGRSWALDILIFQLIPVSIEVFQMSVYLTLIPMLFVDS